MAPNTFQLKYDEMALIAKKFRDQGEDIGKLHAVTRARVRDMRKEWIGEAAEKFFAEMENEALPALERLSRALFVTQDVTLNISKIIRAADEETATFFRDRISGDDFGAGKFGDALQGLQGMRPGADDFGASQFGAALGGASGGGGGADDFGASQFGAALGGASGGGGGGADDFGASKFEEAGAPGSSQAPQAQEGGGPDRDEGGSGDDKKPETEPVSAGGGGGGGGESQGLKGDLKNMGAGLSDQAAQSGAMGASGGGGAMEDTIYSGGGSGGGGGQPQPGAAGTGGGGGGGESVPDAGGAAAAGAAGVVGTAAAGGAAKVIKDQKANDSK